MMELYTWTTNNGRKPIVCLEELGLPYRLHWLDIWKGETRAPAYMGRVHPVGMIPALVDPQGPDGKPITVWESIVILMYLAEKTGRLLPTDPHRRYEVLEWTVFHGATNAPIMDQYIHFRRDETGTTPQAILDMIDAKVKRRLQVMDARLEGREYLCGDFTIADVANWPLMVVVNRLGLSYDAYPNLKGWFERVGQRPAVKRGMTVAPEGQEAIPVTRGRGSPTVPYVG